MGSCASKPKPPPNTTCFKSVSMEGLISYDHGDVPMREVPAILTRSGDYMIWNPLGEVPDPKNKSKRYLSVRWLKQVYHYPINQVGNKVWLDSDKKYKDIEALVFDYFKNSVQIDKNNQDVKLKRAVENRIISLAIMGPIGKGHFGQVFKAEMVHKNQKYDVAVKRPESSRPMTDKERDEFVKESQVMRHYKHPNIVQLYCVTYSEKSITIIMELVNGGSLLSYIRQHEGFTSLLQLLTFTQDACRGMAFLESQKCIHRDLAARNCLLTKTLELKIGDFGLSQIGEEFRSETKEDIPWRWTAPEALIDHVFSNKSDVWSYGVLLFEIFSEGLGPYQNSYMDKYSLVRALEGGYRLPRPRLMSDAIHNVMKTCQEWNPSDRPTFEYLDQLLGRFTVESRDEQQTEDPNRRPATWSHREALANEELRPEVGIGHERSP